MRIAVIAAVIGFSASPAFSQYDTVLPEKPAVEVSWPLELKCKKAFSGQGLDECQGLLRVAMDKTPVGYTVAHMKCSTELHYYVLRDSISNGADYEEKLTTLEYSGVVRLSARQGDITFEVRHRLGSLLRPVTNAWARNTQCAWEYRQR